MTKLGIYTQDEKELKEPKWSKNKKKKVWELGRTKQHKSWPNEDSLKQGTLCICTYIQIGPSPKGRENLEWKGRQKHVTENWKAFWMSFFNNQETTIT